MHASSRLARSEEEIIHPNGGQTSHYGDSEEVTTTDSERMTEEEQEGVVHQLTEEDRVL